MVNMAMIAIFLIAVAVVGAFALSGAFDDLNKNDVGPSDTSDSGASDGSSGSPSDGGSGPSGGGSGAPSSDGPSGGAGDRSGGSGSNAGTGNGNDNGGTDGTGSNGAGSGNGQPDPSSPSGNGSAPPAQKVKLVFVNYAYNVVAGHLGHYDVMAYSADDNSAYTGDLVLQVDVSPARGLATTPAPGDNPGLYTFDVGGFNHTGEFKVKVTPYDRQGHVLGDPAEVSVNVVSEPGGVESVNATASKNGNATAFSCTVKVLQMDTMRQEVFGISSIILHVGNATYTVPVEHHNTGVYTGSIEVPNDKLAPGEPYTFLAFSGRDQVAQVNGTAPA